MPMRLAPDVAAIVTILLLKIKCPISVARLTDYNGVSVCLL